MTGPHREEPGTIYASSWVGKHFIQARYVYLTALLASNALITSMLQAESSSILLGKLHPTPPLAKSTLREAFASCFAPILLASPVLPALSRLQRTLDELDVEGLETVLSSFAAQQGSSATSDNLTQLLRPGGDDEWAAFVATYQERSTLVPSDLSSITSSEARQSVLSCLLSGTFKDCSLLVSLEHGTVKVIDTEPKPPRKLPQWAELDSEIIRAYAEVPPPKRRRCVDANRPVHRRETNDKAGHGDKLSPRRELGTLPFLMGMTAVVVVASLALPMLSG
jgi:hypothetical protein